MVVAKISRPVGALVGVAGGFLSSYLINGHRLLVEDLVYTIADVVAFVFVVSLGVFMASYLDSALPIGRRITCSVAVSLPITLLVFVWMFFQVMIGLASQGVAAWTPVVTVAMYILLAAGVWVICAVIWTAANDYLERGRRVDR